MPRPVLRSSPDSSEGGMTKTYRDWSTDQTYLFPPSPHDWLPQGDLIYFLLDTVATVDLTPIFAHYERELRGQPPFHPRMMVALLLYCYATGTRSSRKIMRRCQVQGLRIFNFACSKYFGQVVIIPATAKSPGLEAVGGRLLLLQQ